MKFKTSLLMTASTLGARAHVQALGTLAAIFLAGSAHAQPRPAVEDASSNPQRVQAGEDEGQLGEIVVTAQRREENLQDVPVSVQTVGSSAIAQRNLTSLQTLAQTTPSLQVGANGRSANLYIRGIGSGENQAFDQSVGTFIDGIYHGRARTSASTFLDLERVEILKGAQSTFFGNNAIAGAFNIITRQPSAQLEANARALYGEDGQFALEGAIGGPLSDVLSARAAVTFNGTDGWIRNLNTGEDQPRQRNLAGRLTLRAEPMTALDATLKLEASRNRNYGGLVLQGYNCPPEPPFVATSFCARALANGYPVGLGRLEVSQNDGQELTLDTREAVLTVGYDIGDHRLTSITGYYDYDFNLNLDNDYTPLTLLNVQAPEEYDQFSQEIRIASPVGGTLEYLAGLYFQSDDLNFQQSISYNFLNPVISGLPPFASLVPFLPIGQQINYTQSERVYSMFGSLTWNMTDRLKLSGGLRGSWVRKRFTQQLFFGTATQDFGGIVPLPAAVAGLPTLLGLGVPGNFAGNRRDNAWMPSARIQYEFSPRVMAYLSYTRGFKSGGFNGADTTGVADNLPFGPESVDAFEAGLKSRWFGNRLLLNLSLFRSNYADLQVTSNFVTGGGAIITLVRNAASSVAQGVELEAVWAPSSYFRLSSNVTYLDSEYRSYPNATPTQLQTRCIANYVLPECAVFPRPVPAFQDLSGRPTAFAPQWSGSITGTVTLPVSGSLRLILEGTGIFASGYYMNGFDDELARQDSYERLDARISLETSDRRWAIDIIAKNLTDERILAFATGWPTATGSSVSQIAQPRNFAVQLRYQF